MSLENTIAAAATEVGKAREAVLGIAQDAQAQITRIGTAYNDRISKLSTTFYVNAASGSDTAEGSMDAPLKTIPEALQRTPRGGLLTCRFLADYHVAENIVVDGRLFYMESASSTRHRMTFERSTYQAGPNRYRRIAAFHPKDNARIGIRGLTIALPKVESPFNEGARSTDACLFRFSDPVRDALAVLSISGATIEIPVGEAYGALTNKTAAMVLSAQYLTINGGSLNGRWVDGVTSTGGTDPASVNSLITNLATI